MQPKIQSARHTCTWWMGLSVCSVADELGHAPILEAAVGQVSSDDEGDFALGKLLDSDLQRVRLAIERYEDRCVHTAREGYKRGNSA